MANSGEEDIRKDYNDFVKNYIWLIRPCKDYKAELKECRSLRGRFHQYFTNGEFSDCSKWAKDSYYCPLCLKDKNNAACEDIIKHETERRMKRMSNKIANDVWTKRDKPSDDWNKPLPPYFEKKMKSSYLYEQEQDFKEYVRNHEPVQKFSCAIS